MSDRLVTYSIEKLWQWILNEEKSGYIFGIAKELFFTPAKSDSFKMQRYGSTLKTPIGVAAGPHTQLAQNIITAWLCGARYIELKTVQILDDIQVAKPCIDMEDEGYNCEWSQELSLEESYHQYLDAYILIHLLRHHFGREIKEPGFIFNMSIGYDLQGILAGKMQHFLDRMGNCRIEKTGKIESLAAVYPAVAEIDIPDCISDNVTLSTMHGCPAEEIEQIGRYLIEDRGLHTTIKLNPTLLGPVTLRRILDRELKFAITVPDEAFDHDLKYDEAVGMIHRLQRLADEKNVFFGIKLTNTLEVLKRRGALPESEKTVYMSGRALHPLSIALAAKLQKEFAGGLNISFSGGADCFNTPGIIASGLAPVTVCTDLLKPGGYARLRQYLAGLSAAMKISGTNNIEEFIIARSDQTAKNVKSAALVNLEKYAEQVVHDKSYHKDFLHNTAIKTVRSLKQFDCIQAPCVDTCPVHQDVPAYMYHVARGKEAAAFAVVMHSNPFPAVTGLACDHACQTKCIRQNIDAPLRIRDIKRFIADQYNAGCKPVQAPKNGLRAAIIGGGPSGLSCAYFLALAGFEVNIYESGELPGGMLAKAIPRFRLPDAALQADISRICIPGVSIHGNSPVDASSFRRLREEYDYLYIAVGAQQNKKLHIPGENLPGVYNALNFLADARRDETLKPGKRIAVIGGGDSAVDAARTARRLVEKRDKVTLIYRRTRKEMPANRDELAALLQEDINILELAAPLRIERQGGRLLLHLQKMSLGQSDASGRPAPVPVPGSEFKMNFDALIVAVGQNVVLDFLPDAKDAAGASPQTTKWQNVFIGGDAMRGPATIITAIADGKQAAELISKSAQVKHNLPYMKPGKNLSTAAHQIKMATRDYGAEKRESAPAKLDFNLSAKTMSSTAARTEAGRCLFCDDFCNVCVSVCPNRANISYRVSPVHIQLPKVVIQNGSASIEEGGLFVVEQGFQVLNMVDFCNECGNCTTFCPTSGAPYRDKPRICLSDEAFAGEAEAFKFEKINGSPSLTAKKNGSLEILSINNGSYSYETVNIVAEVARQDFRIRDITVKSKDNTIVHFDHAAKMSILLEALSRSFLSSI